MIVGTMFPSPKKRVLNIKDPSHNGKSGKQKNSSVGCWSMYTRSGVDKSVCIINYTVIHVYSHISSINYIVIYVFQRFMSQNCKFRFLRLWTAQFMLVIMRVSWSKQGHWFGTAVGLSYPPLGFTVFIKLLVCTLSYPPDLTNIFIYFYSWRNSSRGDFSRLAVKSPSSSVFSHAESAYSISHRQHLMKWLRSCCCVSKCWIFRLSSFLC